ncbi:MAG: bifunctional UDP-N-acetylglucosamine diphosphorylase/glucosamine-1-phosphate N-acetyltransferase GlmU [Acidobacteria bacterium]|nr:bifunctional UDP-N-acetylglucosamine diphosphorylase/glucosamine-1-phosphate N-acetyltransferase GlmU [Acidobacteriota bacterium]MBV9477441.1 bifunctional UDP-N-acetylglucosamine diphosphorylase/glucosamine-1-phosphate N-acetyltransferase GlmU [Acidobacteriota bacterium]
MNENLEVIILAAGLGTRMKSKTIKILHRAAGRPIVDYVLDLAAELTQRRPVMVVGHQRDAVQQSVGDRARYAVQEEQLGTGHAVLQAAALVEADGIDGKRILVLSGDVPLTRAETLRRLLDEHARAGNALTLLTMKPDDPAMYGRIVRDDAGAVQRIVEAKDASDDEKRIGEVNAGIYVFDGEHLFDNLRNLKTDNAQKEYYLTDLLQVLRERGHRVGAVVAEPIEALGVNSRSELAQVESEIQRRVIAKLMSDGVTFRNPATVVIDSTVRIGADTVVYPFVTLEGTTTIGEGCVIDPGVHLMNVRVGDNVHLKTGTVADDAVIEDDANVGPYAHLRPGSHLGKHVKVGNFVETKKAVFGDGAKASHLSYIGDAEVGADVNIGAGTITCNYDGVHKHKTIIEDGAFIGSDTQLVAPVRVGRGAYVGAGSTITKDVPAESLALSRTPQRIVDGWARRKQKKSE